MNNIIKYSLLILAIMFTSHLQAQNWSNGTSGNIYYNQGNVGIGTSSPVEKLSVNGNIGIIHSSKVGYALHDDFAYDGKRQPHYGFQWAGDSESIGSASLWMSGYGGIKLFTRGAVRLRIDRNGNVGIGTTTPDSKLAVNGNIRAKEIKLETANWPDYVFDAAYQPMTLRETKAYIAQHGHLPGLKSAAEYEQHGVNMMELNQKLLEKIEELTLYLIKKDEEITELKAVWSKLSLIEKRLEQIKH